MTAWDVDRALDDADTSLSAYDSQCVGCGALYDPPCPSVCALCGCGEFEPAEDLVW